MMKIQPYLDRWRTNHFITFVYKIKKKNKEFISINE